MNIVITCMHQIRFAAINHLSTKPRRLPLICGSISIIANSIETLKIQIYQKIHTIKMEFQFQFICLRQQRSNRTTKKAKQYVQSQTNVIFSTGGNEITIRPLSHLPRLQAKKIFFFFAIFILHSRESELYRYTLDGKSALAWELPFSRFTGHLSST